MTKVLLLLALVFALYRLFVRPAQPPAPSARLRGTDGRWDPYTVLGLARGASPEEVTHAYREQLKRYHPDRVADLGPELREVAHEKTLEIQRAYDELSSS